MSAALPVAVVFDCDGTIVDTEPIARRVMTEVLARFGYEPTVEDFRAMLGHPGHRSYRYLAARVELPPEEEFRGIVRARWRELVRSDMEPFPDAVRTIRALAERGVPMAVTSSSSRGSVDNSLAAAGVDHLITLRFGSDDVSNHKPHPEPYLRAARGLDVAPGECTAVEDTGVGVAAARAAGMRVVGVVRREVDPASLQAADLVVDELSLDALRA